MRPHDFNALAEHAECECCQRVFTRLIAERWRVLCIACWLLLQGSKRGRK